MRNQSIDVGRGLAIATIVLGHVLRGLPPAGVMDAGSQGYILLDRAIYLFHLSVFAFLSGLFMSGGVRKHGEDAYLKDRLLNFMYLYVLWSVLQEGLLKAAAGGSVNRPVGLATVLEFWKPQAQFWFLPFLAVCTVGVVLIQPWASRFRLIAMLGIAAAVSVWRWSIPGDLFGAQGLGVTIFLTLGVWLGSRRFVAVESRLTLPLSACLTAAVAAVTAAFFLLTPTLPPTTAGGLERTPLCVACGAAASAFAVLTVLLLSSALSRVRRVGSGLAYLGRASLQVFLAHILAASGTRIVLLKIGVTSPALHLCLGVAAGIAFPLMLNAAAHRLHATWLFAPPATLDQLLTRRAPAQGKHRGKRRRRGAHAEAPTLSPRRGVPGTAP